MPCRGRDACAYTAGERERVARICHANYGEQMLDPFPAVIDLVAEHETDRKALFRGVIAPLYKAAKSMVKDHLGLIRRAKEVVKDEKLDRMEAAIEELHQLREEMSLARTQAAALAEEIAARVNVVKFKEFTAKVELLFGDGSNGAIRLPGTSMLFGLVHLADGVREGEVGTGEVLDWLKREEKDLAGRWKEVSAIYTRLRIQSLVPRIFLGSR